MPLNSPEPPEPGIRTEADADARVVLPYLESLGIQADQVRAQRTFSLKFGRNMIRHEDTSSTRTSRLDYLVVSGNGSPLFVVEIKAPNERLTDADRDQGISYARLVHPIAPLVLLTNTRESRLYDTITKDVLRSASDARLVQGGGQLTADEDIRVRSEALEHFIGYSIENIAAFSRVQRTARMRSLRGGDGRHARKYEPDLYLRRDNVRRAVHSFLASEDTVFVLGGRSGFGKTNELCALAEELGETHVTLFFSGVELTGSLGTMIAEEFDWYFSNHLVLPQICQRLARLSERSGRPVLLIFDAVDEANIPDIAQQLSDLAGRLAAFHGRIRLIVSTKTSEWSRFASARGIPSALQELVYCPPRDTQTAANGGHAEPNDAPQVSAVVGAFTPEERDEAIGIYSAAFSLQGRWSVAVRELASDPFMLRLIAEVASASGVMPQDPGERELVRRYLEQWLSRTANPRRARLELVEVARALALAGGSHEEWGVDRNAGPFRDPTPNPPSVDESRVRIAARLPATAEIAEELVAFGVLVPMINPDGQRSLAFAYDRVRDYLLATEVFRFEGLGRDAFRDAALSCLSDGPGTAALQWYFPYVTADQWEGFVEAATQRLGRLLDTYEGIRAHIGPAVRATMDPGTSGRVGAVFAGARGHLWFDLALFRMVTADEPRVRFDPKTFDALWNEGFGSAVAAQHISVAHRRVGFWFLQAPEQYAANYVREELMKVVKEGRLSEGDDEYLLAERVVALAHGHRGTLGLRNHAWRAVPRFADSFVALELFPLDLVELRRRVQTELGLRSYQDAHMEQRQEAAIQEHAARGEHPRFITTTSEWSRTDIENWRERAAREVDAGRDFANAQRSPSDLQLLAVAVEKLLHSRTRLDEPLLPPPDLRDPREVAGVHNFEEGYSDAQLARLLEAIFGRARRAYEQIMAASFSDAFRALLVSPPPFPAVLCFRRRHEGGRNDQFAAVIDHGAALRREGDVPMPSDGAIAAVVYPGGPTRVENIADEWLNAIVITGTGCFTMRTGERRELSSVVSPYDAPPFIKNGSGSAPRTAPVRARAYALVKKTLDKLSIDKLLTLALTRPC